LCVWVSSGPFRPCERCERRGGTEREDGRAIYRSLYHEVYARTPSPLPRGRRRGAAGARVVWAGGSAVVELRSSEGAGPCARTDDGPGALGGRRTRGPAFRWPAWCRPAPPAPPRPALPRLRPGSGLAPARLRPGSGPAPAAVPSGCAWMARDLQWAHAGREAVHAGRWRSKRGAFRPVSLNQYLPVSLSIRRAFQPVSGASIASIWSQYKPVEPSDQ
jgi:hypothetical protein